MVPAPAPAYDRGVKDQRDRRTSDAAASEAGGAAPGKRSRTDAIQRRGGATNTTAAAPSSRAAPLPEPLRAKMEDAFDFSFAHVRVSEGPEAPAVGAQAYTQGTDVHFAPGQYQPDSAGGQDLVGHELAHVVQQHEGRVPTTTQFKGVGGNDDAGLEREADELGGRAARGEVVRHGGGAALDAGGAVQRQVVQRNRNITETTDTGNQYTQELMVDKARNHAQVQLGIKWVQQGTWTDDATFNTWQRAIKTAVYGYMDHKFKVELTPVAGGAKLDVTIDFLLWNDDSGYEIKCWGATHGRGAMATAGGNLYEFGQANETVMPPVYAAHEFGHALLGVSDEYANAAVPRRPISNDHSIMGDFYSQGTGQAEYKVRHFQNIGAEVVKDYPGYTARVVPT